MKKIGVLIGKLYEEVEYSKPAQAFKDEGYSLVHIGKEKGEEVFDKNRENPVTIDETPDTISVEDIDALLIPGGFSPDNLRSDDGILEFLRQYFTLGKPLFTICHGAQLLVSAEVLSGRTLTCYKSVIMDVKNAGANYVNREVVIDNNLISSRNPNDLPAFIEASLNMLKNPA